MAPRRIAFCVSLLVGSSAVAHPGHRHDLALAAAVATAVATPGDSFTGEGDLRFRYRPDLSELPEEIAKGIVRAHGGFAKTPSGEVYFGLEGTGLVRVSADLRTKSLVGGDPTLTGGALHNTTYLPRDGGLLVLPDPMRGQVFTTRLNGELVATLGRPRVNDYYRNAENGFAPTDSDLASDGKLYVCDGYSEGKFVLTADVGAEEYDSRHFGGIVAGEGRQEGRFSTNHGVTFDPTDETLLIADRERQWVQRVTLAGQFVEGLDTAGANPCDVDFVEHGGERLMVVGCLVGPNDTPGVVQLLRDGEVVSTLRPKLDLGLAEFQHIHNAVGVVVDGKLYVLCYGWNPGCYAALEHVAE